MKQKQLSLSNIFVILFFIFLSACGPVTQIPDAPQPTPETQLTPIFTPMPDMDCSDDGIIKTPIDTYYENGRLARMGKGQLFGIDWSKDGTEIAIASETGVYIIDAIEMKDISYINTGHSVEVVRFSPDGNLLAVDDGPHVAVWDLNTGEVVALIGNNFNYYSPRWVSPSTSELGNISFSPDGRLIAIHSMNYLNYLGSDSDPRVEVWDIETQTIVKEWSESDKTYFRPDPVFSPDGVFITSPWKDGVTIWNVGNGDVAEWIEGGKDFSFFSNKGDKIVTADNIEGVIIVDLGAEKIVRVHPGNSFIEEVVGSFTADDAMLVTHYNTHEESHIDTWDAITGKHLLSISLSSFVFGIAISPVSQEMATIDYEQSISIWNLEDGSLVRTYQFSNFIGSEAYPSPDGSMLVVKKDESFHLYNALNGGYLCALPGLIKGPFYASFNPYGREFAYIQPDGHAVVWDLKNGDVVQEFISGELDEHGQSDNGPLVYKNTPLGNQYHKFIAWGWLGDKDSGISWIGTSCDAMEGIPTTCPGVISKDGKYIATLDIKDGDLIVHDANSYDVLYRINDFAGSNNFAFSPDGNYILSLRFLDWGIDIWQASTREKVTKINSGMEGEGPILGVQEFSFTSDGNKLLTYMPYFRQSGVRLWDTKTWKMENSFDTMGGVGDAKISGDGSLITALSGYVVYLWRLDK